ncbi:YeiH family protein [Parabacteroides bouchesdurhonensis]|uniref:YeiH family protein n=1 Tax=Parabacteroides bouchesdurhonensis TaxID=1936995 RepID=UPI003B8A9954
MPFISPAVALFLGLAFAMTAGHPFPLFAKKTSKYLLQFSVVGLGFGMNLHESLQTGKEGMVFTVISVAAVLLLGMYLGKRLMMDRKTAYLISAGTAICGGSAIAAVAPVVKADDNEMSMALGTIFILNAVALFIFPPIGHLLGMTQEQFGMWAAIAIHDTSSVVGAGAAYGEKALEIATMVKLTRALWIIPVTIVTMFLFKQKGAKISIPWFIFFFILAMIANTYLSIPEMVSGSLVWLAKKGLTVTLFLIGTGLSRRVIKNVGVRPMIQGVILWIFIGLISLGVIMLM